MHHSNDADTVFQRNKEHDVAPEWEAVQTGSQLLALAPHHGLCRPQVKALIQLVDPAIRLLDTVRRDVIPNLQNVRLDQRAARDPGHLCRGLQ